MSIKKRLMEFAQNSPLYLDMANINEYSFENEVEASLVSKKDLQQYKLKILNKKYAVQDINNFVISRTSGSSGEPLEVYWTIDDFIKSNMCLWRLRKKYYGIDPNALCVGFHAILYNKSIPMAPKKIVYLNGGKLLSFSKFHLEDSDLEEYMTYMEKYQPQWMIVQPSVAFRLKAYMEKQKKSLPASVEYIELNGEQISRSDEQDLKAFFGVKVANMYGCNEVNAIAYECPCGNMHILDDNVLVQIKNCEETEMGTEGDIILSSLKNSAFPIIGYELGDRIVLEKSTDCACGKRGSVICDIKGRSSDLLHFSNDMAVSSFEITYCVEYINSIMGNPIKRYSISENDGVLFVRVFVEDRFYSWKESIQKELGAKISEMLPGIDKMDIIVKLLSEIRMQRSGKANFIEKVN